MNNSLNSKQEKELLAQKKRLEALKYLNSHGCTQNEIKQLFSKGKTFEKLPEKKTDNTLDYLLKQSAQNSKRRVECKLKEDLLQQQKADRNNQREITVSSIDILAEVKQEEPLLNGWIEKIHPATNQIYYLHKLSGGIRSTRPTETDFVTDSYKLMMEKYYHSLSLFYFFKFLI